MHINIDPPLVDITADYIYIWQDQESEPMIRQWFYWGDWTYKSMYITLSSHTHHTKPNRFDFTCQIT